MGSRGNRISSIGLSDKWLDLGTDPLFVKKGRSPEEVARLQQEFMRKLMDAGIFGTEEQQEAALKETRLWRRMQDTKRWGHDAKEVDAETYLAADYDSQFDMYMSMEEFKKIANSRPDSYSVPGTLSAGLSAFYHGANPSGYGRGKDARIKWDEQYGFSNMIDNHPELQFNSNSTIYRGIRLSGGSIKDLYKAFNSGSTIDFRGPSSWTADKAVAEMFLSGTLVGQANKNLTIFEDVTRGRRNAMPFNHGLDSELLYSGTSRFHIVGIEQDEKGVYHVKVRQANK